MRIVATAILLGVMLTLSVRPVAAHHAFAAEFDAKRPVKLEGTVTRVQWINPHAWIHIDVKQANGSVVAWMIECGTPNVLIRRGINKDSLKPGTRILVDGFQAKDGSNKANGRDVTLPDGKNFFLGSSGTGAPAR
ncbi:MAG: DUF6152 family protein [Vicinamibacterales bacterium]